jgi:hypothetical protein
MNVRREETARLFRAQRSGVSTVAGRAARTGFDRIVIGCNSPAMREMSFNRASLNRLARECEIAKAFSGPSEGNGSEYEAEEAERERYRKLGVRNSSRFSERRRRQSSHGGRRTKSLSDRPVPLILMPKTGDNVQSIHIDLTANRLNDREAMTVIIRFLSVMTWCDDNICHCRARVVGKLCAGPRTEARSRVHHCLQYSSTADTRIRGREARARAVPRGAQCATERVDKLRGAELLQNHRDSESREGSCSQVVSGEFRRVTHGVDRGRCGPLPGPLRARATP